ncbi:MAG: hypothetical protein PQJ44_01485, partial [Sphaerochaetaceae bacterium]|nr:hypothetical protein [Sphaerochaetaceae bacterium]
KSQFKEEFKNLKSIISKSKYYRGSWIFDLMKFRFQYIDNPDFSNPLKLKWQISSLENDLQEYLNKSLNDNYTVFTDVRPIVLNDSLIYMTSRDSNIHQEIHIWDISKSEKLFYENPKDNSIKKVKMINGIGKLTNKQVTEFPNGYQGFFKVETKRGDGNSYWFSNK